MLGTVIITTSHKFYCAGFGAALLVRTVSAIAIPLSSRCDCNITRCWQTTRPCIDCCHTILAYLFV